MKKEKKKIIKYFHRWTYRLGLNNWERHLYLLSRKKDIAKHFENRSPYAVAFINTSWQYMILSVYINMNAIKDLTNFKLEKVIIHELVHALVNEMTEGPKHEERVVTNITNAIVWTIDDVLKKENEYGKKKKGKIKKPGKTSK